ncbi:MAG: lipopolysaccharide biosynthesis protein [Pseudomonadales bacterium]|nr:lipopolysaccharide biosynthesis protein [Pseudomonadales bacterium]
MSGTVAKPGRSKRLIANFGLLVGGRTMGAVLALAANALAARTLGVEEYGLVVMVQATAMLIRQLVNLKTGEAVIRYGVPLAEDGRVAELKGLLLRFVRLDLTVSLLAAVAGAVLLIFFAEQLGLPAELRLAASCYVPVMLLSVTGTANGTLRLLDRFGTLSTQLAVGPAVKLGAVALLLLSPWRSEVSAYLMVWALAYFVEQAYTWWRSYRAFRNQYGGVKASRIPLDPGDVRSFLFTVYWQSTLDAAPKQVATLLAGTLLGSAAAGLFAFARELANVLAKPVSILRQVVFPDLARLWRNDLPRFLNVTWRTGALTGGVGIAVAVLSIFAARPLLVLIAGTEFAAAGLLLTLLLTAAAVELSGATLRPAGYVMGRARALLKVQILATAVYLGAFAGLVPILGLTGVGAASIATALVNLIGCALLIVQGYRHRLRADAALESV